MFHFSESTREADIHSALAFVEIKKPEECAPEHIEVQCRNWNCCGKLNFEPMRLAVALRSREAGSRQVVISGRLLFVLCRRKRDDGHRRITCVLCHSISRT